MFSRLLSSWPGLHRMLAVLTLVVMAGQTNASTTFGSLAAPPYDRQFLHGAIPGSTTIFDAEFADPGFIGFVRSDGTPTDFELHLINLTADPAEPYSLVETRRTTGSGGAPLALFQLRADGSGAFEFDFGMSGLIRDAGGGQTPLSITARIFLDVMPASAATVEELNVAIQRIPEPSTALLLIMALLAAGRVLGCRSTRRASAADQGRTAPVLRMRQRWG